MKQKQIVLAIMFLILIGAGLVFFKEISHPPKTHQALARPAPLPREVTITLDKNGFSPKEVTVHVGSAVRWENMSGDKQTVNSDLYPLNNLHRELNFGIFNASSSVQYIFTKPGTYTYHNQLHPEQSGKVIVVK